MYIENLENDFYNYLLGKRIFMIVHYDVDSICTCRILQSLIKFRNIPYSLAVVQGVNDLKRAYQENCKDVKHFVLINCGGTVSIIDILDPEDDVVFFVLDSHKPTDLYNVYSNGQVRLLSSPDEDGQIPEFHDVFREESGDDESDDGENDESEERTAKRRRLGEEEIIKRRERRLWEENSKKLQFEYSQFAFYGRASAIIMYNLAYEINKDDKELLWFAIVALTEQFILGKIENAQYVLEIDGLQTHVNRHSVKIHDKDITTSLKICLENDLKLILYRHWSVESSLKYSLYTACKLKLWTYRGDKKLYELLAEMGLPLAQSRQTFRSMDLQLRKEFHGSLEKLLDKYELHDLTFLSFTLQFGFRNKYCASDFVYALLAILECSPRDKQPEELFNSALDCLSRTKINTIDNGIERAKTVAKILYQGVKVALDMKQIITAGPFIYYIIQDGCLDWYLYSHQHILRMFAQFVLKAYVSVSRNRKAPSLPLIVSAPKNLDTGSCIVLGIPPLEENSPKNYFGKAFEQAAENINCESSCDFFDTSYFEIFIKDRTKFFDALTSLLT